MVYVGVHILCWCSDHLSVHQVVFTWSMLVFRSPLCLYVMLFSHGLCCCSDHLSLYIMFSSHGLCWCSDHLSVCVSCCFHMVCVVVQITSLSVHHVLFTWSMLVFRSPLSLYIMLFSHDLCCCSGHLSVCTSCCFHMVYIGVKITSLSVCHVLFTWSMLLFRSPLCLYVMLFSHGLCCCSDHLSVCTSCCFHMVCVVVQIMSLSVHHVVFTLSMLLFRSPLSVHYVVFTSSMLVFRSLLSVGQMSGIWINGPTIKISQLVIMVSVMSVLTVSHGVFMTWIGLLFGG